jgi:hypothetical protein
MDTPFRGNPPSADVTLPEIARSCAMVFAEMQRNVRRTMKHLISVAVFGLKVQLGITSKNGGIDGPPLPCRKANRPGIFTGSPKFSLYRAK